MKLNNISVCSLIWLKWKINKKEIIDQNIGLLTQIVVYIFALGVGYSLYLLLGLQGKIDSNINVFDTINLFFLAIVVVLILSKIFSPEKYFKQIDLRKMRYYPINFILVLTLEQLLSFLNRSNTKLFLVLLGFLIGLFGNSWANFHMALLTITLLVFFVHQLSELVEGISLIFNKYSNPKKIIFTIFLIPILYLVLFDQNFRSINPVSNTLNELIVFSQNNNISELFIQLFYLILMSILLLLTSITIKFINLNSIDCEVIIKQRSNQNKIIENIVRIFNNNIQFGALIEKELKYLLRNRRVIIAIISELVLNFMIFLRYNGDINNSDEFLILFLGISISLMIWDYYLSNYWGPDKIGFGFYILSPIRVKNLIIAKNVSFMIIKFPIILFVSIFYGVLIGIHVIPFSILLFVFSTIQFIVFANYNSLKNPSPVDLSENILSSRVTSKFSLIGFIGLVFNFFSPAMILLIIWKYEYSEEIIFIQLILLILIMIIFTKSIINLENYFVQEKQRIYNLLKKS